MAQAVRQATVGRAKNERLGGHQGSRCVRRPGQLEWRQPGAQSQRQAIGCSARGTIRRGACRARDCVAGDRMACDDGSCKAANNFGLPPDIAAKVKAECAKVFPFYDTQITCIEDDAKAYHRLQKNDFGLPPEIAEEVKVRCPKYFHFTIHKSRASKTMRELIKIAWRGLTK
jgi:hypothetical protein